MAEVVSIKAGDDDPLGHFSPEGLEGRASSPDDASQHLQPRARWRKTLAVVGIGAVVGVAIAAAASPYVRRQSAASASKPAPPGGRAVLRSRPSGAAVLIDGVARGTTPLELELAAGTHDVVLQSETGQRSLTLAVEGGTRVVEDVDMPAIAPSTAQIDITSEPSAARVMLDARPAGQTPLKIRDIAAGRHDVTISDGSSTVHRTVDVTAGMTASVFVSLGGGTSNSSVGTLAVESPVELRLLEGDQLLGLSNAAPVAVSAGKHQFDFVNDALELRLTRTVTIDPGKTTRVSVPVPNGIVFVNASPWAEVFVDGRSIGVTPLGEVSVPVGIHEIVWRHPQLGERRRTVTVGARTPVRVAVDMTR